MMIYPNTMSPLMWLWMLLSWVIWFALLGFVVWLVVQWIRPVHSATTTPLDILRQRYARGEIDRQTYVAMRHDLGDARDEEAPPRPPSPTTGS